jgi:hypothetical protein
LPWEKKEQRFDYIYGNPPFVGKSLMNTEQKADMEVVFSGVHGAGVLDFVTAWYIKAAKYLAMPHDPDLQPTQTRCSFVSTNSIAQGEQVGILWNELFNRYHIKIHFAHRTFKWSNEARGKAAVHVVIIGFSDFDIKEKRIFEYHDIAGEPHELRVANINPYLVEGKDIFLVGRRKPICSVPNLIYGNKPVDDGNFFLTDSEKNEIISRNPLLQKYIRPILSSYEFINGKNRWCLWLVNADPAELSSMPDVLNRLERIRQFRSQSPKASVQLQAQTPTLFSEIRQPDSDYVIIPRHSSELRRYIPIGFFPSHTIVSDSCTALPKATLYHFGILTSAIHQTWIKYVCGRIKSDYRYSNDIVYNNFPWPENPSEKQKKDVEDAAQKVLDTRAQFPGSSLADLYDTLTMPPALVKAHQELDKAVDLCYRPQPFPNETKRIEFLFELYDKYTADLFTKEKFRKKRKI